MLRRSWALVGLALAVALGSLLRLLLGLAHRPWMVSSDAYAWGLLLDEPGLRLDQLVHLPHEGGSLLVGLLALPFADHGFHEAWPILPALSMGQLLADTAVRAVQVGVAWRLLGPRSGALFAAWTIAALPGLLPWALVPPNLHATASFWPFLLALAWTRGRPVGAGLLLGASLAFSYDNLVLVPILLGAGAWDLARGRLSPVRAALASLAALVSGGLGLAWQSLAPLGSSLVQAGPGSLRGEALGAQLGELTQRLPEVLGRILPEALFISPYQAPAGQGAGLAWLLLAASGLGLALRDRRGLALAGLCMFLTFLVLYAGSPFLPAELSYTSFYAYRHLVYILPSLAALAIHGLARLPGPLSWSPLLLILAGVLPLASPPPPAPAPPRPLSSAGWHLGQKLGEQPGRVEALIAGEGPEGIDALRVGVGWGITAAVMSGGADQAPRLAALLSAYPLSARPALAEGARQAYAPDVTPRLPGQVEGLGLEPWTLVERQGDLVHVEARRVAFYGTGALVLDLPGQGPIALRVSGDPAEGRGPRFRLEDTQGRGVDLGPVGVVPETLEVPALGTRLVLRYDDDLVDASGADRNLYLWWVERTPR